MQKLSRRVFAVVVFILAATGCEGAASELAASGSIIAVQAEAAEPTSVSDVATATVYASTNTPDGKVVLVIINKATTAKTTSVALSHSAALNTAAVYQLTSGNPAPVRGTDLVASQPNSFSLTLPAMSVTTLILG